MKYIWKAVVHFEEDIEGEVLEDFLRFNIIATDDVEARKKGVKLAQKETNENIRVLYVELENALDIDE